VARYKKLSAATNTNGKILSKARIFYIELLQGTSEKFATILFV
jgi:hypothetical protein